LHLASLCLLIFPTAAAAQTISKEASVARLDADLMDLKLLPGLRNAQVLPDLPTFANHTALRG